MESINSYNISVSDEKLEKLAQKLSLTSFPDELDDAGWDHGAPLADVKRLTQYWIKNFSWRVQESKINELPNYMTSIEVDGFGSLDVHFIHRKSKVAAAIPLLFVHGWPGNFLEVSKLLPLLCSGGEEFPAFHIVAPSLPNFGFSSGTSKRGFSLPQYAETFNKLMHKLGYSEYVTQGGDWGSTITRIMGLLYPSHVLASHINMIRCGKPTWTSNPILALQHAITPYSLRDRSGFARSKWFETEGRGYNLIQSTKPQTIGYALTDSPVGLLAWIYEKLHDWTDAYPWTDDEILTWVSIYWFSTAGPAASLRIYYEAQADTVMGRLRTHKYIPLVKLGLSYFPRELTIVPKTWGRTMGLVVYENDHEDGGHFAASEKPMAIASDLRKMFGKGGGAFGVIKGKDGYVRTRARL